MNILNKLLLISVFLSKTKSAADSYINILKKTHMYNVIRHKRNFKTFYVLTKKENKGDVLSFSHFYEIIIK